MTEPKRSVWHLVRMKLAVITIRWAEMSTLIHDQAEVDDVNKSLHRDKPQPMHHTQQYRDAYRPAYRVVLKLEILKIIGL